MTLPPGQTSWKEEFKRLHYRTPLDSASEVLGGEGMGGHHGSRVTHIDFARDGVMLASCAKDASVCVWDTRVRPCRLLFRDYLDQINWQSAIHCQFNQNSTRLMVSGVVGSRGNTAYLNICITNMCIFS